MKNLAFRSVKSWNAIVQSLKMLLITFMIMMVISQYWAVCVYTLIINTSKKQFIFKDLIQSHSTKEEIRKEESLKNMHIY